MAMEHRIDVRVYYEDTDAGGVMYYANFLKFAERGRTELLRAAGFENSVLGAEDGVVFVVRRVVADYLKPARLDDLVCVRTAVTGLGRTSVEMLQSVFRGPEAVCRMVVTLVCVGRESMRPVRLPHGVRAAFEQCLTVGEEGAGER